VGERSTVEEWAASIGEEAARFRKLLDAPDYDHSARRLRLGRCATAAWVLDSILLR